MTPELQSIKNEYSARKGVLCQRSFDQLLVHIDEQARTIELLTAAVEALRNVDDFHNSEGFDNTRKQQAHMDRLIDIQINALAALDQHRRSK